METWAKGGIDVGGARQSASKSSRCFAHLSDGSAPLCLFMMVDRVLGAILLKSPKKLRWNGNGRG